MSRVHESVWYNWSDIKEVKSIMRIQIVHQPKDHRFIIEIENKVAYIEYEKSKNVLDLTHTIVPREMGGQGLGTQLVKYALAYARVEHLKVIPTCSFVAALMDKHVVYQDLRV